MAPKAKITREDIIKTTLNLVRAHGEQAINARAIAAALNCSTQPIFSNFTSMNELQRTTCAAAYDIYLQFIKTEIESKKYPKYKSYGMAYIRFAKEERELFKLLFMRDRTNEDTSPSPDFKEAVQIIAEANSITNEAATRMHLEMWAFVHGIATMLITSFLALDWDCIEFMLTDIYKGIQATHTAEDKSNARN